MPVSYDDLDPELGSITATDAKNRFGMLLMDILEGQKKFAITRNGRAVAVILSHVAFERMMQQPTAEGEGVDLDLNALSETTATDAKNKFGTLLMDILEKGSTIAITRNNRRVAIMLGHNRYNAVWRQHQPPDDDERPAEG